MITQEELDRWISELRSGELRQIRGTLVKHDDAGAGYCCLGAFCEKVKGYQRFREGYKNPYESDLLLAGLAPYQDIFEDRQRVLSGANDAGKTFEKIADFLEEVGLSWVNGPNTFGSGERTEI